MAAASTQSILKVVHIDDDPFELDRVRKALGAYTLDCRFALDSVGTPAAFEARLAKQPTPDIILVDIDLGSPDLNGIKLAAKARRLTPDAVILMCSFADDAKSITEALSAGADDFISKRCDRDELGLRLSHSYRLARLKRGTSVASGAAATAVDVVGATMSRVAQRVPQIIGSAITAVFVGGESGTGKEVVAGLFQKNLPANCPFVPVNCAAIAPTLLESELFGHVKGAFTGATADKRGLFEAASGGWIFLDEVATLGSAAQAALLRVLENGEVLRVGATKPTIVQVRVISATNENMEQMVKDGRFRKDLWQRLQEAEIKLPALRDRPDEIKPLVEYFCRSMTGGPYTISGPALEILASASWRGGNVRELRNCLRAMTEMHVNKFLTPLAIPPRVWEEVGTDAPAATTTTDAKDPSGISLPWRSSYDDMADLLLVEMTRRLSQARGKQISMRELAEAIGIARSTLSGRFQSLRTKRLVDFDELAKIVNVSDKK